MREKLETLSLAKLKEFAKEQEIKGYGSMRKAELIEPGMKNLLLVQGKR